MPFLRGTRYPILGNTGVYIASIYQGTKTTDTTERTERLATGVTGVDIVSNAGTGLITVKVDHIVAFTVADGVSKSVTVSGAYITWSSANSGTAEIGQGKL